MSTVLGEQSGRLPVGGLDLGGRAFLCGWGGVGCGASWEEGTA